mmetsp:Transcript_2611/g.4978  ORF Transcript_2611/g.4978 Transcript_2611/m.4978 type:complete len:201 (-) Transcript_2611:188-790(-)|eukprot:CAMPEP_0170199992 /NCGR_PEP_ID=MMETSP0040_2-20121228/69640_1 /TAXON_ID=641309 /ORGANISM="Lotharella oceanica, Strain CCMP622" /LENGTH=200 /DNA_ID=CAMNT_0010450159 /DNA_START=482 /DNA_END=1084 /DNA_ORIENTATION=+
MPPPYRNLLLSLVVLCALTSVDAECRDNDNAVTQQFCDAKYPKVCYTNDNGTYHHGCLSCDGSLVEYDCDKCECKIKPAWIAGFVCIGIASALVCCGVCCAFCTCCPLARWRASRAHDYHQAGYQRVQHSQGVVHAEAVVPVANPVASSPVLGHAHRPSAPAYAEEDEGHHGGGGRGWFGSDEPRPSAPPKSGPLSPESQ